MKEFIDSSKLQSSLEFEVGIFPKNESPFIYQSQLQNGTLPFLNNKKESKSLVGTKNQTYRDINIKTEIEKI